MIYLDTSVLIAAHTSEPESARTINWMAAQKSPFMVSLWTITEFASALSRQVRSRRLTLDERARAAGEFQIFLEGVTIVAPEPEAFRLAARMMEKPRNRVTRCRCAASRCRIADRSRACYFRQDNGRCRQVIRHKSGDDMITPPSPILPDYAAGRRPCP